MLDVSRITTGKLRLAPTPFDLSDLVREIVADVRRGCSAMLVTPIGIDAPASLPGTWDRLAMEQIIDNLVSNAIKYGAHQPVEVRAEARGDKPAFGFETMGPAFPWMTGPHLWAASNGGRAG